MKQGTLASAARVVRQLAASIEDLRVAQDAYEQERRWDAVLTIIDAFYNRFVNGIKKNTAPVVEWEWLQRLQKERDDDPLLEYLQHARHNFIHGNAEVGMVGQHVLVSMEVVAAYKLLPDPKPDWNNFALNHSTTLKEPLAMKLRPVERRGGRSKRKHTEKEMVYPPLEHMGKYYFSLDPLFLATIAQGYIIAKFKEAEELVAD